MAIYQLDIIQIRRASHTNVRSIVTHPAATQASPHPELNDQRIGSQGIDCFGSAYAPPNTNFRCPIIFRSARGASRAPVPSCCLVRSVWRRLDPCHCEGAERPKQSPASAGVVPQRPLLLRSPSGSEGAQAMATPPPSRSYQRSARDRCCPSNRSSERSRRILRTAAALMWLPDT